MAGQVEASPAELAGEAAELVRALNYATLPHASRLAYPGDVYDVLGSLKVMADRLPQLCGQLARFLLAELDSGRVVAVGGQPFAGNPAGAVAEAGWCLSEAESAAAVLASALSAAQQAIAGLAHHDPPAGEAGAVDAAGDDPGVTR